MDVDRRPGDVLDVVDRDAIRRRIEKDADRILSAYLVGSQRERRRLVEIPR
jgi:hypothetical protein